MTEKLLEWIEEHARQKGFTDEESSLALVAEVRRLQEALRDYGRHDDARCEYFQRCVCGFDAALRGEESRDG